MSLLSFERAFVCLEAIGSCPVAGLCKAMLFDIWNSKKDSISRRRPCPPCCQVAGFFMKRSGDSFENDNLTSPCKLVLGKGWHHAPVRNHVEASFLPVGKSKKQLNHHNGKNKRNNTDANHSPGRRDQVRRSLTALEDSAVLVNAIEECPRCWPMGF